MRLKISIILLSFCLGLSLQAQKPEISFRIKNAGVFVEGAFDSIQVNQSFDPNDLTTATFSVSIPVSTIDTGIKSRDRHLLKPKYFDIENHQEIVFRSTRVTETESGYKLTGDLSIKSTTRSVDIDFTLESNGDLSFFKGYLELDRRDYGVGKNHLILGDLVRITIQVPVEKPRT